MVREREEHNKDPQSSKFEESKLRSEDECTTFSPLNQSNTGDNYKQEAKSQSSFDYSILDNREKAFEVFKLEYTKLAGM